MALEEATGAYFNFEGSDGLPLDQFNVGRAENVQSFSQELRLNYDAGGRFDWVTVIGMLPEA